MVMVNIIKSGKSKAVLKIRVGFMQLNTLLVECWAEKKKTKKQNLGSSLFSSPVKTVQRGHILNTF